MKEEITIEHKGELKKCVSNLTKENTIYLGFKKNSIFIDHMDKFGFDILLQSVDNVSTFISERNSNGFTVSVDPKHLYNALSMCTEKSPITFLIDENILKVTQDNASYTFPIKEFKRGNSFREDMCDKVRSLDKNVINSIEIQMSEIKDAFEKIYAAEAYGILPPIYRFRFSKESSSLRKGDNLNHNLTIALKNYNFYGVQSDIEFADRIEKICDIFYPEFTMKMKSNKDFIVHFSQKTMNTRIDFVAGGMSE